MYRGVRRAGWGMVLYVFASVAGIAAAVPVPLAAQEAAETTHRISFKFDYDFHGTPACTKKMKTRCVQEFVLYDISVGIDKPTKLGTVPVPEHAKGLMKGITATTEPLVFNPGRHMISVVARMNDGTESNLLLCTTIVRVP
jgi:hypothetical protein